MFGRLPKVQAGAWQLISVNINRQCSSAISVIVEKLMTLVCAHAHLLVIFSFQETRSWDVPYLDHCDFSVELGLLCTDDDDNDELNEMCGPLCWQDYERDPADSRS